MDSPLRAFPGCSFPTFVSIHLPSWFAELQKERQITSALWRDLTASQASGAGLMETSQPGIQMRARAKSIHRRKATDSGSDSDEAADDAAAASTPAGTGTLDAFRGILGPSGPLRLNVEAVTPLLVTAGELILSDSTLEFAQAEVDAESAPASPTASMKSPAATSRAQDEKARKAYAASLLKPFKSRSIALSAIASVEIRRYQLQVCALFFSVFLYDSSITHACIALLTIHKSPHDGLIAC